MCFSSSAPQPTYSTPPAPEPTPESVRPILESDMHKSAGAYNKMRMGLSSKRTDLNVPAVGNSGTGLHVPT